MSRYSDAYDRDLPLYQNPHGHTHVYDRLGRQVPHRLDLATFLGSIPAAPGRLRQVPARAVVEAGQDAEGEYTMVECPCGGRPTARANHLTKCSGCERYYVSEAGDALVLYGDMPIPSSGTARPKRPSITA